MALVCMTCGKEFVCKNVERLLKKYEELNCDKCQRKKNIIKKYGSIEEFNKYCQLKRENGFLKKYGVKNPSLIPEVRKRTNISIKKIQNIRMKTLEENNLKNFGVKHTFQRVDCKENIKKTMNKLYGVDSPLQNKEILEKMKNTMIQRYGVTNIMFNEEKRDKIVNSIRNKSCEEWSKIALKRRKKYYKDDLYFDSKWELIVYNFCKENNIDIKRGPTVLLDNGRKFEIDFIINGRLCEIKSSYYIKIQKNSELKVKYLKDHNGILIDNITELEFLKLI